MSLASTANDTRRAEPLALGWDALRREVRAFVARRVSPADTDDVVQEVLLALSAADEAPRAQRTGAYVHGIARHVVAEHHRRRAREHARLARLALEPLPDDGEPVSQPEAALASALTLFLPLIGPLHRDAVRAVDLEGRAQADVARELGVPLSTLRTRVQRGRAELRALMRRCCEIELDVRGRVLACEPRGDGECGC